MSIEGGKLHHTEHSLTVDATAQVLYDLVADVSRWPVVFKPSVHVRHLERRGRQERFQLWALVHGEVHTWTSRRCLNPQRLHIAFEQEVSQPPVASMAGEWRFRPLTGGRTEVVLRHRFTVVEEDAATVGWIEQALHQNSTGELAALARIAGLGSALDEVVFSFTDEILLPAGPAEVYRFVHEAGLWAERLPHVEAVRLSELGDGVQELEMDTLAPNGEKHSTRSLRVCHASEWIAYKQLAFPELLLGHAGLWSFEANPDGTTRVRSQHIVALDPAAVPAALGPEATLSQARELVYQNLSRNSRATIAAAGQWRSERAVAATAA